MRKLTDLTEDELTGRFRNAFGPAAEGEVWTGDDAAVIGMGERAVFTTDVMTEHVDFEFAWATGADVGYKLIAVNVSDVAAMGAIPSKAVATMTVVVDLELAVIDGITEGMKAAAGRWGVSIVGGDIGRGSEVSLSLALLGDLPGPPLLRSGARSGDAICVTGSLGGAAAGLLALRSGLVDRDALDAELEQPSGADALATLAARQLRPNARLEESRRIAESGATAMIDISDGLALDLNRLLTASGVGCEIAASAIPIDPEIAAALDRLQGPEPARLALTGGEDFELLFTIEPDLVEDVQVAVDEVGTSVTLIGRTTEDGRKIDGEPLEMWMEDAWDHLRSR
ncbi:MAG: thiamine-phosphate kinase [Actinomycetota bacterium]